MELQFNSVNQRDTGQAEIKQRVVTWTKNEALNFCGSTNNKSPVRGTDCQLFFLCRRVAQTQPIRPLWESSDNLFTTSLCVSESIYLSIEREICPKGSPDVESISGTITNNAHNAIPVTYFTDIALDGWNKPKKTFQMAILPFQLDILHINRFAKSKLTLILPPIAKHYLQVAEDGRENKQLRQSCSPSSQYSIRCGSSCCYLCAIKIVSAFIVAKFIKFESRTGRLCFSARVSLHYYNWNGSKLQSFNLWLPTTTEQNKSIFLPWHENWAFN